MSLRSNFQSGKKKISIKTKKLNQLSMNQRKSKQTFWRMNLKKNNLNPAQTFSYLKKYKLAGLRKSKANNLKKCKLQNRLKCLLSRMRTCQHLRFNQAEEVWSCWEKLVNNLLKTKMLRKWSERMSNFLPMMSFQVRTISSKIHKRYHK